MLLTQGRLSLTALGDFLRQPLLDGRRARQPLGHRCQLLAPRHHPLLKHLEIMPQLGESFRGFGRLGFRSLARTLRVAVRGLRLLCARPRCFRFSVQPRDLPAFRSQLLLDAAVLAAHLVALVRRGHQTFLGLHVLGPSHSKLLLRRRNRFFQPRQLGLLLLRDLFEPRGFGFVLAQLALQRERARLSLASARDHAPVIAGSIRREEVALRVFARQAFGNLRAFDDISRAQLRNKLFRGRAKRFAEFHELIEPCENSFGLRSVGVSASGAATFDCWSESTKNVARPPISSRSSATPARAWSNDSTTTYSSSSRRNCSIAASYFSCTSA